MKRPQNLRCDNGLFVYDDTKYPGRPVCLGFLMDFQEHGVFDARFGRLHISPAAAEAHNRILSQATIAGLDHCEIGQGGSFYYSQTNTRVHTFIGEIVADRPNVTVHGKSITFTRNGKTFRGRLGNTELFYFKRIK